MACILNGDGRSYARAWPPWCFVWVVFIDTDNFISHFYEWFFIAVLWYKHQYSFFIGLLCQKVRVSNDRPFSSKSDWSGHVKTVFIYWCGNMFPWFRGIIGSFYAAITVELESWPKKMTIRSSYWTISYFQKNYCKIHKNKISSKIFHGRWLNFYTFPVAPNSIHTNSHWTA